MFNTYNKSFIIACICEMSLIPTLVALLHSIRCLDNPPIFCLNIGQSFFMCPGLSHRKQAPSLTTFGFLNCLSCSESLLPLFPPKVRSQLLASFRSLSASLCFYLSTPCEVHFCVLHRFLPNGADKEFEILCP